MKCPLLGFRCDIRIELQAPVGKDYCQNLDFSGCVIMSVYERRLRICDTKISYAGPTYEIIDNLNPFIHGRKFSELFLNSGF